MQLVDVIRLDNFSFSFTPTPAHNYVTSSYCTHWGEQHYYHTIETSCKQMQQADQKESFKTWENEPFILHDK